MRSQLFCLVIFSITFSEGAISLERKLDWMFLKREENSVKYRIKESQPYNFARMINKYSPVYLDADFNFMSPVFVDNQLQMQLSEQDKPICQSTSVGYKTQPDFAKQYSRERIPLILFPRTETDAERYNRETRATCRFIPTPSVKLSSRKIKNVCEVYRVGYAIETASLDSRSKKLFTTKFPSKLVPLYEVCYDQKDEMTHYTYHKLNFKGLDKRQLNPYIKEFDFPATKKFRDYIRDIYHLDKQFYSYNFFNQESSEFQTHSNYLVPVYLVPMYDMFFENWQFATSEIMNIAPQWRKTNLNKWLKIEESVRLMAWRYQTNLNVFTGVIYKANMASSSSSARSIDHRIKNKSTHQDVPIPQYFYKYIADETYERGIVLLVSNGKNGIPENTICRSNGWENLGYESIGCYEASYFFKNLSYTLPDLKYPKSVMTFSKSVAQNVGQIGHTNIFSQHLVDPLEMQEMNEYSHLWQYAKYFRRRYR